MQSYIKKILIIVISLTHFSCLTYYQNIDIDKDKIRIACVGDSITYGFGIPDKKNNSYPSKLQKKLGNNYHVSNLGVNGATLLNSGNKPYRKQKAYNYIKKIDPDIYIILLGTNDSKPKNWKHKQDFKKNYKELISIFRTINPDAIIYVCYPTPSFPGIWGIRNEIISKEIIPVINNLDEDITFIDLYSPFLNKKEYFPDSVHPNIDGSELMAEIVYNVIKDLDI